MENKDYYLGLDIGTDSIGYAVTDKHYKLLKFHGERMWGATLFDEAGTCAERRSVRTSRRRLHRRQHRIQMLREIFAKAIAEEDPHFFMRIDESWKLAKDKTNAGDLNAVFNDHDYTDKEYHRQYPTMHHLLCELMENDHPHDVRLVYLACAWLMAHRGHFFSDLSEKGILEGGSFDEAYENLIDYFEELKDDSAEDVSENQECGWWKDSRVPDICAKLKQVMQRQTGISRKVEAIKEVLVPEEGKNALFPLDCIIKLLAGGRISSKKLFSQSEEDESISLDADEDTLDTVIAKLGDDGEMIRLLKQLYDGAELVKLLQGKSSISSAKRDVYDQHRKDLDGMKSLCRKYLLEQKQLLYARIFKDKDEKLQNYPAYISESRGKTSIVELNDFLKKELLPQLEDCASDFMPEEKVFFEDMKERIMQHTFLPKQVTKDNRTIPYQLYKAELQVILANAQKYLPFLKGHCDSCSISEAEKILSIFSFRTPYYVGPQPKSKNRGKYSPYAWLVRKSEDPVRPWNLEEVVNTKASEEEFIKRMVNDCTYCPGKSVLPMGSLLYQKFIVLNELNNIRVNGEKIAVTLKQGIFEELFKKHKRVTRSQIVNYLKANLAPDLEDDQVSGIDIKINSSLNSYHQFKPFLESGSLSEDDIELIIMQRTCTEDTGRFLEWLKEQDFATRLDERQLKQIGRIQLKDFGRLSRYFLAELDFADSIGINQGTVIQFLWDTTNNLNELLSDSFTLKTKLEQEKRVFYGLHPLSFEDKLDNLYLSSHVKRQIYRTKDIVDSVIHAMKGTAPKRIFVEMARGASPDQKNKRTLSRREQLIEKLKHVEDVEVKEFREKLEEEDIQNRLQSDKLFLWFMQLGKCPYCGQSISFADVYNNNADIDHIYPQCLTKDDSIIDNKVLAHKACNGNKTDIYPLPGNMRQPALWQTWKRQKLISDEKFQRLNRLTPLTDEEKQGFINRQIVETRQTTKAVLNLLKERFPDTEVVAVKAGLVSDYRQEFGMLKCRSINDLHHAKDAFLNIVVGNVYHEIFTKNFFIDKTRYSMKTRTLFEAAHKNAQLEVYWAGGMDIAMTRQVLQDNHVHLTKFQISKTDGKLFDTNIVAKGKGQIQRKTGLPIEAYGGYNKPAMAGFVLVAYAKGKTGHQCTLIPIALEGRDLLMGNDDTRKQEYMQKVLTEKGLHAPVSYPLGLRLLRMGAMLSFDGMRMVISGRSNDRVLFRLLSPFYLDTPMENYIKRMDNVLEKQKKRIFYAIDPVYDKISADENLKLFDALVAKIGSPFFRKLPGNPYDILCGEQNREHFANLIVDEQVAVLREIVSVVKSNRSKPVNLSCFEKGSKNAATVNLSNSLSNWAKVYKDVRLIDTDAAGLFETISPNLLDFLK